MKKENQVKNIYRWLPEWKYEEIDGYWIISREYWDREGKEKKIFKTLLEAKDYMLKDFDERIKDIRENFDKYIDNKLKVVK